MVPEVSFKEATQPRYLQIPIPLPCLDAGKAGSGVNLTTNDTLLAMPLNVHISPIA